MDETHVNYRQERLLLHPASHTAAVHRIPAQQQYAVVGQSKLALVVVMAWYTFWVTLVAFEKPLDLDKKLLQIR
jgi:hypothetical protein